MVFVPQQTPDQSWGVIAQNIPTVAENLHGIDRRDFDYIRDLGSETLGDHSWLVDRVSYVLDKCLRPHRNKNGRGDFHTNASVIAMSSWEKASKYIQCGTVIAGHKFYCGLDRYCDHCSTHDVKVLHKRYCSAFHQSTNWYFFTYSWTMPVNLRCCTQEEYNVHWTQANAFVNELKALSLIDGAYIAHETSVKNLMAGEVNPHTHVLLSSSDDNLNDQLDVFVQEASKKGVSLRLTPIKDYTYFKKVLGYLCKTIDLGTIYGDCKGVYSFTRINDALDLLLTRTSQFEHKRIKAIYIGNLRQGTGSYIGTVLKEKNKKNVESREKRVKAWIKRHGYSRSWWEQARRAYASHINGCITLRSDLSLTDFADSYKNELDELKGILSFWRMARKHSADTRDKSSGYKHINKNKTLNVHPPCFNLESVQPQFRYPTMPNPIVAPIEQKEKKPGFSLSKALAGITAGGLTGVGLDALYSAYSKQPSMMSRLYDYANAAATKYQYRNIAGHTSDKPLSIPKNPLGGDNVADALVMARNYNPNTKNTMENVLPSWIDNRSEAAINKLIPQGSTSTLAEPLNDAAVKTDLASVGLSGLNLGAKTFLPNVAPKLTSLVGNTVGHVAPPVASVVNASQAHGLMNHPLMQEAYGDSKVFKGLMTTLGAASPLLPDRGALTGLTLMADRAVLDRTQGKLNDLAAKTDANANLMDMGNRLYAGARKGLPGYQEQLQSFTSAIKPTMNNPEFQSSAPSPALISLIRKARGQFNY